jgi:hypothetical protein
MAAGATYTPIASYTLSSDTSAVEFTSIPATWSDLVLITNVKYTGTGGTQELSCFVNSDTGSNYSLTLLQGNGTAASSARRTSATSIYFTFGRSDTNASGFALSIANFMNYSNTTTYKTILSRNGESATGTAADVNLWRSTTAINRITFSNNVTYKTGSTFTLYGIAAA